MGAFPPVQGGAEIWRFHVMNVVRQSRRLGTIGSIVGLLALLASALTQLLPAVFPPEPYDHVIDETGQRVKDHLIFRAKRLEIRPRETSEQRTVGYTWNQGLSAVAVSLGLLAIALAVFSVVLQEEKLLAGIAAALGIAAIAVQVYWILIGVVILIVIVNALFS
jgi:hypothetical protein